MKRVIAVAALTLFALAPAGQASAQVSFGPQVVLWDFEEIGVGGRVNFGLGQTFGATEGLFRDLFASVNASYVFTGEDSPGVDVSTIVFNGNVAVPIPTQAAIAPYAGAGINVIRTSVSAGQFSGSNTSSGLNLLGGLNLQLGRIPAFAELQYSTSGAGFLTLSFGVMFGG